jgi:tetratricopeptide (TPR) repeat protein
VDGVDFLRHARSLGDDFDRLRRSMRQLAEGVSALHQFGKLHCDLKPQNVLVSNGDRVLILDFGLVRDLSERERSGPLICGTPGYMSPEQAAGRALSPASDWYSLGVILYEALTGQLPFSASLSSVLREQEFTDPAPVGRLRPNAPADLCDLAAALLQHNPLLRPDGFQVLRLLGSGEEELRAASLEQAPFVGRQRELDVLYSALDETGRHSPVTVFIHGPSGVGKSTLVHHFLDEVRENRRRLVLEGRCYERESASYKALDSLVDNLNRHLTGIPKAERASLLPADFPALKQLFPILDNLAPVRGAAEIANAAEFRLRGFKALRKLVGNLAARQPVVLLIDDLQWGDVDSAAFLLDLVCDPDPAPILFLACYRSDEAETSPLLRQLLRTRTARESGRRMELAVQELEYHVARDLALLLSARAQPLSSAAAEQIARESGGNPFLLTELVKHAQTEPLVEAEGQLNGESISLSDLVRRRVMQLPEQARRLLEVIALAAQPIELAIAKDAARMAAGAYTELAQLRRHRLVRSRHSEESERIEAYHDGIRKVTESSLSPQDLRDCHYRLATAWESAGRTDPAFLAIHFRGAGVTDKALVHSIRAAEEATSALAFDNAAQFYRFAVELAPKAQRDSLQVRLGEALCNAGRGAEGAEVYLATGAGSGGEVLELRRRAAAHFLMAGRIREGLALTKEVLGAVGMSVPRSPWQALLSFFLLRARIRARGLEFRERLAAEIPSLDLFRIDLCASLVQGLGMVDPIRALPFHGRLLLLALRSGELTRISRAFSSEAAYFALQGGRKREKVERLLGCAQRLADRSGSPNAAGLAALATGAASFLRGEWKDAVEQMTLAEGILRERCSGVAWEVATAHMMGSVSLYLMGELKALKGRLPRIIKDAEARGDLFEATDLRIRLGHTLCLAVDNHKQAHEEIRSALREWRREEFDLQHWWAWIGSIETDLYEGDAQTAWARARSEWPKLRWSLLLRIQYVCIESLHHRARAALALASSPSTSRRDRLQLLHLVERDAHSMTRQGVPWSTALATLLRAGISCTQGVSEQTAQLLNTAEDQLDACDMALYAAAALRSRGKLLGGEQGRALSAQAEKWMQDQEILNPERMIAMLAPGF